MKLSLRSSGGFSGPAGAVTRTVDLAALGPDERQKADALVAAAKPFEQPNEILLRSPRPWDFQYFLEVSEGDRVHRIHLHLEAASAPLRELVEWLEEVGKPVGHTPTNPSNR